MIKSWLWAHHAVSKQVENVSCWHSTGRGGPAVRASVLVGAQGSEPQGGAKHKTVWWSTLAVNPAGHVAGPPDEETL